MDTLLKEVPPPFAGTSEDLTENERLGFIDLFRLYRNLEIESAQAWHEQDTCLAVLLISYDVSNPSDTERAPIYITHHQTVAYLDRPGLVLPEFEMMPKFDNFIGSLAGFTGMQLVEFPELHELDRRYSVSTLHPDSTRSLFTQPVVEALLRHHPLNIRTGRDGQIAVYRQREIVPPAEQPRFLASALELADRIFESAAALPREARPSGKESVETIKNMGGLLGARMRDRLVTSEQVNDFLEQPTPRAVPGAFRKLAYGSSGVYVLFGLVLMAGGGAILQALWTIVDQKFSLLILAAMLIPLGGVFVSGFALRHWLRRRRILRHGSSRQAKVTSVKATGATLDGDPQHEVVFKTSLGEIVADVGSGPASLARLLQRHGKFARLLVDPDAPSRGLWIEGWAMDAYL